MVVEPLENEFTTNVILKSNVLSISGSCVPLKRAELKGIRGHFRLGKIQSGFLGVMLYIVGVICFVHIQIIFSVNFISAYAKLKKRQ